MSFRSSSIPILLIGCTGAQLLLAAALLSSCSPDDALLTLDELRGPGSGHEQPAGPRLSLAGRWRLFLDPGAVGVADGWPSSLARGEVPGSAPGKELSITVPGPLESISDTANYDGVVWYATTFRSSATTAGARQLLCFGQANYHTQIWIDEHYVGEHEGGYDAFEFDVSAAVRPGEEQVLSIRLLDPGVLRTGGMTLATTPHAKESWYHNFGGLLGPVELVSVDRPVARITHLDADPDARVVRVEVDLIAAPGLADERSLLELVVARIPLRARWDGTLDGLPVVARGRLRTRLGAEPFSAELSAQLPQAEPWSPNRPQRYAAVVLVDGEDAGHPASRRSVGFRSIQLDADGLRLNGRLTGLYGVLYQPHWAGLGGMTPDAEYLEATVATMLATGFNLVRAHVRPAPPAFLDAADRQGLMVLQEPAIGWVEDDPDLAARLAHEVDWMVARDHHHPAIIMWGILNELSGKAYRYGRELTLRVAAADATRPVLEDSGGFFGGRYVPTGGDSLLPMHDEHFYPPFPLPYDERQQLSTLAHPTGPTFVSEFGYGTLLDTRLAASGFRDRMLRGSERNLFGGLHGAYRRARERGEDWLDPSIDDPASDLQTGWILEAGEIQAQAARAMLEALRLDPAIDMICYTQWRAVSAESSAGLLSPWGKQRPVLEVLRQALRPLMLVARPVQPSVLVGETLEFELFVVNDSGAPVWGRLEVEVSGAVQGAPGPDVPAGAQMFPSGVTRVQRSDLIVQCDTPGKLTLVAQLVRPSGAVERSREVQVAVIEAAPARQQLVDLSPETAHEWCRSAATGSEQLPVALHLPEGRADLAAFASRQGFAVTDELFTDVPWDIVSIIGDPASLLQTMSLQQRLELWQRVWYGGSAVVMLRDPIEDAFGRLVAGHRGSRRLVGVPLAVSLASAAGNFRGRVHPVFEASAVDGSGRPSMAFGPPRNGPPGLAPRQVIHADRPDVVNTPGVRLLTEHDGLLSPEAMLVGALPPGTRPAMLTLDHVGTRIGAPVAALPFGRGTITVVGLPLLDTLRGVTDPLRDETLAHLVLESAAEVAERFRHGVTGESPFRLVRHEPLPDEELTLFAEGFARIARAVELADRYSTIGGTHELPPELAEAFERQIASIQALVAGHRSMARRELSIAHDMVWTAELVAFLALDEIVIDMIVRLLSQGGYADRDLAYETLEFWRSGVEAWFSGETETAYAWLGRAELLVNESGRLPDLP
jgi:hypothetical protein